MNKKGFTLLELVVVVIILGILATLGFTQYTRMVEKGRTAEAKMILGQIRTAQVGYHQQWGTYTSVLDSLSVEVPSACAGTHYYYFAVDATTGTATRCTAAGKAPQGGSAYNITLTYAGVFAGTAGYF